jgi:16S rRNA processing protein RimM
LTDRGRATGGEARIEAGRVGRAHGLDGSFHVTRPRARLLELGALVSVADTSLRIVRRAGTDERPIVRLEGVETREAAEAMRGAELSVAATEVPPLPEGEWWAHELEGCLVAAEGRPVGTVTRLVELPSCEALEVRRPGGGEALLVPMVRDAVLRVSPQERLIEVNLAFLNLSEGHEQGSGRGGT